MRVIDFKVPYNRSVYLDFLKNYLMPEDLSLGEESLDYKTEYIQNAVKLADVPSLDLAIYEVHHKSEHDPRVSLSRDTFRMLSEYGKSRALVIFTSKAKANYRFSLVKIDLEWKEGKRVKKEYSNPRRYSFYLGPDTKTHTPEEYLIKPGRIKDIEDLKKRFSIEVVNKEFYTKIALLFTQLAGGKRAIGTQKFDEKGSLALPSTSDENLRKEFSVRLIGRLVFCWFLKKKHSKEGISLLPDELLSTEAVKDNGNYYHKILELLFFQVLNTPVALRNKQFAKVPWGRIPFLNGGLFTPHPHDYYDPGFMELSKHINTLKIPDKWFLELFEIFETYNFTIDENTSIDVELSIDPEMLGRIFENLLAEINPETGETARKATGSYYTPRPIVEYMVDQSLKEYLLTKTKVKDDRVKDLLAYEKEDVSLKDKEKEEIIDALDSIKIIDPACGSGAFPMGCLQKMLLILQKVDPRSSAWLDKQIVKIENPILRKEAKEKLRSENVNYIHKLGIIQSAIYGVDIQPIAVEISKLRFFLSLIVDEKVDDTQENRGVEPLPNLEFKFVCANSLIGLPKRDPQQTMFEATDDISFLKDLRDEYLSSYGEQKKKIEKKFQETQSRMFKHSISWGGKDSQTLKLSQWNPFSDEPCSWFDPEWMFGVKGGFDIVIANPPYVFTRKMDFTDDFKRYVEENYFSQLKSDSTGRAKQSGKINLFCLFIIKGINLSKDKGLTTYIVPNTILRTTTYDIVRKYILDRTNLKQIVDLGGGVFDSVTAATVILIMSRTDQLKRNIVEIIYEIENIESHKYFSNQTEQSSFLQNISYTFNVYVDERTLDVLRRVKSASHCLGEFCIDIIEGIVAHKHLITKKSEKGSFPLVEGKDIKRYFIASPSQRILWNIEQIHRTRPDYLWKADKKIVIQRISGGNAPLVAALDVNKYRTFASVNNLVLKSEYETYYNYFLAILNSKLANFYYANSFSNQSNLTVNISKTFLESIPVVIDKHELINEISQKADKIITDMHTVKEYDRQQSKSNQQMTKIDQLIYELYGLTKKEIETVEKFYIEQDKK